jgi:H+/Cl- antiporter ClcA
MLLVAAWALPVGAVSAFAAWALLRLIGLITNAVFYQRVGASLVAPGGTHHSPWLVLLAPVVGGLVVGLMARFGSERIRGHGMPEAIEAILVGGSRVAPRVAALKPVSAAISIGTGGPFGAEGPIIMTGGALGSILAQALRLSADERKTLLVAGAAGGMAATFNSPLAAVILAVELLLFEWRPRSLVPVVAAVSVATLARAPLLGTRAIFAVPAAAVAHPSALAQSLCLVVGITGGLLAVGATALVYLAEDLFHRIPVHWMWWPALGGLIIGLGGLVEPRALGVGYDVIGDLLTGRAGLSLILGILVVKTLIWGLSLGSGTSGGVLAPVFMIGGALGALEGHLLPHVFPGFWAMAGLAAVVGGVMRSPLTGVVFTLELTHAWSVLLPMLIAAATAYALSTLMLKRSVLTEKIARRGLHLTREYSTDPLETFFAEDVMSPGTAVGAKVRVYRNDTLRHVANVLAEAGVSFAAVVSRDEPGTVVGRIGLADLLKARLHDLTEEHHRERQFRPLRRGSDGTDGSGGSVGSGRDRLGGLGDPRGGTLAAQAVDGQDDERDPDEHEAGPLRRRKVLVPYAHADGELDHRCQVLEQADDRQR